MFSLAKKFFSFSRSKTNQAGYSLIQISIGIMVLGLLTAPLVSLYLTYQESKKVALTYENVSNAVASLQNYRKIFGEYPCPSPLNVPRDDDEYGHSRDCSSGPVATASPGTCLEGVCIEQSTRTLPAPLTDPNIVVGAIPFRLLQTNEKDTIDGYGNRIVYAVTRSQTDQATFNEQSGGIHVQDDTGAPLSDPPGSATFLVYSPGRNKVGAYDASGVRISPCIGGQDAENCNPGFEAGTFSPTDSVYVSAFESNGGGAGTFDDVVQYFSSISEPVWKTGTGVNIDDINDLSPQFVGIGTPEPATELEISAVAASVPTDALKVYGTSGSGGRIMADLVCDEAGVDCFNPDKIAGTGTTACPTGEYVVGIANGDAVCDAVAVECPDSMPVFKGIDADGDPICGPLPGLSCPAQLVNRCGGNDISLPTTTDTVTTAYINSTKPGTCLKARYRCNNGSFSFVNNAPGSTCNFVPVSTSSGNSCGQGYSGTYTNTTTRTCNLAGSPVVTQSTTNDRGTACTCTGGSFTTTPNCPSPTSGTFTRTITYTPRPGFPNICDSTTTEDRSTCACSGTNGATRWVSNGSCSSPYTNAAGGPPEREQRYNGALNRCAWENTGVTRNPCVCGVTSRTEERDHACTNPVCEEPDPANKDLIQINYDPDTCTPGPESTITEGSCRPRRFTWQTTATIGTGTADVNINEPCSCDEHTSDTVKLCSDPAAPTSLYRCACRP